MTEVNELRDAALRAAVWQTVEAKAKEQKDFARQDLAGIPVGETVAARWNGELLAKAAMAKGKTRMVVTNEAALVAWVKAHHPTEIVEAVNKAFLTSLEARAKDLGLGAVIDSQGEVIPGVEIATGDPVVSVRKEKGAEQLVADMLTSGRITLDGLDTTPAISPTVVEGEVADAD